MICLYKPTRIALAAISVIGALLANDAIARISAGEFATQAEAQIGRDASSAPPRRHSASEPTGVYGYGAGDYGAPIVGGAAMHGDPTSEDGCYETVDAYGQVVTRCP